jgi:hypothetical protein
MVGKYTIVIAAIIAVIIAVTVSIYASGMNNSEVILSGEGENSNMVEAVIKSDGGWSATINDGKSRSYNVEGSGDRSIPIACDDSGGYSLVVRKSGGTSGTLIVEVTKNGNVSQKSSTTSTNGIISISGNC